MANYPASTTADGLRRILQGYEHAVGGFSGGVFSTLICHPMDLLKIRYSANEGDASIRPQYRSYYDCARQIIRSNGVSGLYQGLTPNLLGGAISWGLYLQFYNKIKQPVSSTFSNLPDPATHFICGVLAGSVVMCFTNPIWVAKTSTSKKEGFRSLYRGFLPGLFGTTHGAVQFMIYDWLKDWRCAQLGIGKNSKLGVADYFAFSALSKIVAVTVTYPYQVVRTRMQDHNIAQRGVLETIRVALRNEGPGAFYKGLLIANVRTLPATVVTLLTYEQVHHFLQDK
ncbi:unnamed protein product, partial [Mesorhabditis belari]|uniref:Mitochondrial folate transporter/carrier n=1 Tax=Mesorhabditis belari TaxID=2138241 RepID=A0AAF3EU22_9BILA